MHLAPIDVSRVPRYRRIPAPFPRGHEGVLAGGAMPMEAESPARPLNWFLVAFLAWEISQLAIGVYYGVKLALVVT